MRISFISATDIDELFMTTVLFRVTVTLFIIKVDTKGSAPGEASHENVKLAEFIIIGEIVGF